jgi:hypothetical protein
VPSFLDLFREPLYTIDSQGGKPELRHVFEYLVARIVRIQGGIRNVLEFPRYFEQEPALLVRRFSVNPKALETLAAARKLLHDLGLDLREIAASYAHKQLL